MIETKTTNYHNEQSLVTSSDLADGEEEDWYYGSTRTSSKLKIDLPKSKRENYFTSLKVSFSSQLKIFSILSIFSVITNTKK